MKSFPSNIAADLKTGGWKPKHRHIGEAEPIVKTVDANGTTKYSCSHDFMTPNPERTECYLPQRIDVGKHFIFTGGVDGQRESYQSSIQRVTSFGRYYMGKDALENKLPPLIMELFEQESFQKAAKDICPKDKQYLDPFQFNVIMQIPGQTVASHIDAPYFWGADRLDFPQWFLAVMVFSNLFKDRFIDQVQVVGYLSDISPPVGATQQEKDDIGGEFIYYQTNNEGRYTKETADYLAGSCVDGSKLVHASRIYRGKEQAPFMDKDKNSELIYIGNNQWELRVDDELVATYPDRDLRVSIVYRARCFEDEDEYNQYNEYNKDRTTDKHLKLDYVMQVLIDDMISKNVVGIDEAKNMSKIDMAMLLMDHYIKYPMPSIDERPYMPYNYCLINKALPWLPNIC
jgi:hypothetical protein